MSADKNEYCYSLSGDEYTGSFATREEALAKAQQEVDNNQDQGEGTTVYTGRVKHASEFLEKVRWIGEGIVERIDEALSEHIAADDAIVELTNEKTAELTDLVKAFICENATFNRWGVTEIQEHQLTSPE